MVFGVGDAKQFHSGIKSSLFAITHTSLSCTYIRVCLVHTFH